jgi:hypothetical protein
MPVEEELQVPGKTIAHGAILGRGEDGFGGGGSLGAYLLHPVGVSEGGRVWRTYKGAQSQQ